MCGGLKCIVTCVVCGVVLLCVGWCCMLGHVVYWYVVSRNIGMRCVYVVVVVVVVCVLVGCGAPCCCGMVCVCVC